MQPVLHECFGFGYEAWLSDELALLYTKKFPHFTADEIATIEQCRDESGTVDVVKFGWRSSDRIVIYVPDGFMKEVAPAFLKLARCYLHDIDTPYIEMLYLMTVLLFRNKNDQTECCAEYDKYKYAVYQKHIRHDMLKLYCALNEGKSSQYGEVRISFGNGTPVRVENREEWFSELLQSYLNKYLGVESIEEAESELRRVYGKKVGSKIKSRESTLYIWGIYHLLQHTSLKSGKPKSVTNVQCRFICDYLRLAGLTIDKEGNTADPDNLRARLNFFLKNYDTLQQLLDERCYKLSPNSKGGTRLW